MPTQEYIPHTGKHTFEEILSKDTIIISLSGKVRDVKMKVFQCSTNNCQKKDTFFLYKNLEKE